VHALKNLKLAHYVDRLQDENDDLMSGGETWQMRKGATQAFVG
jgi:hypothetical protein